MALALTSVAQGLLVGPAAQAVQRVAAPQMVQSKALPFLEAPANLDGSMVGDNVSTSPPSPSSASACKPGRRHEGAVRGGGALGSRKMSRLPGPLARGGAQPQSRRAAEPRLCCHAQGFDPLGLSAAGNIKWMREAELKHGRIAMLAVLGWIVQETAPASIHPGFPTVSNLD